MRAFLLVVLTGFSFSAAAEFKGVGRDATDAEVKAWDIDVRPDFQGLPSGSGSVSDGETLWIAKCSSCHGDFGDANHVFVPLVGNTTAEDIKTGRVASLKAGGSVRTTFTKVATVSTLWDYIHRAMPWDAPKSLSHNDVYALLAYLLNLAEIVPTNYVLSDKNMAEVQARMPNRNGVTREHGLWDLKGKPDTHNVACVKDCKKEVTVLSELPAYARNAHGNLADQNRSFGPVRGVVTASAAEAAKPAASSAPTAPENAAVTAVLGANGCTGCHGMDKKILGPGFNEIAAKYKYKGQKDAKAHLTTRIKAGGSGVWGQISMPPQPAITEAELTTVVDWLLAGAAP
ncbi:MAG: c-type cytochrome [Panacagrimonas sp.]